ncbi:MAG: hypothetical protein JWO48_2217 [Bryobacterales bacterium]|nr:hypothetical protein [Bryobacterales bacterium]
MKLGIFVVLVMGLAAEIIAADKPGVKKVKPAPASAPAKATEITIPAGAVEVEPYIYRYTDPAGKNWIYRKTPFGVMRLEDKPVSANAAQNMQDDQTRLIESTSAAEDGDAIRFERAWPFGRTQWKRKKTELNDVERAVWNREMQKRATHENASKD